MGRGRENEAPSNSFLFLWESVSCGSRQSSPKQFSAVAAAATLWPSLPGRLGPALRPVSDGYLIQGQLLCHLFPASLGDSWALQSLQILTGRKWGRSRGSYTPESILSYCRPNQRKMQRHKILIFILLSFLNWADSQAAKAEQNHMPFTHKSF